MNSQYFKNCWVITYYNYELTLSNGHSHFLKIKIDVVGFVYNSNHILGFSFHLAFVCVWVLTINITKTCNYNLGYIDIGLKVRGIYYVK